MKRLPLVSLILFAVGCTSVQPVNMKAPRRVVGTESAVRIDAEVVGDELRSGVPLPITYEITNQRSEQIAIADIIPETTFDADSNTVTINIGSEVPGTTLLPRLIAIAPGEKKSFATTARIAGLFRPISPNPQRPPSLTLRIKVNFLGDTTGFDDLLMMTEKAVADAKRADEVFTVWLERNEAVYTNGIPMRWMGRTPDATSMPPDPAAVPSRRRGRG